MIDIARTADTKAKVSKSFVDYTPRAKHHDERCELCRHFEVPRTCLKVAGDISPKGWCKLFKRK